MTAALALARNGFRVTVLEQSERLEETGAGIQLSPNAARTLIALGLEDRLRPFAVAPTALRVMSAASGREIVRMPLGKGAEQRYGAPYWMIHRGDLQAALLAAVTRTLEITLKLGARVEDFVAHPNGITVSVSNGARATDERGLALIGADGLWSQVRQRIGYGEPPRFTGRTAWRSLVPAREVAPEFREPIVHLWLGSDAHLVHYPVKASQVVNVVVITAEVLERAGVERARRPCGPRATLGGRSLGAAGACARQPARRVAEMGALRAPANRTLVPRTSGAVGRRRPSDAPIPRARRGHGHRGRRSGRAVYGASA